MQRICPRRAEADGDHEPDETTIQLAQLQASAETPENVAKWQAEVCRAWARAIGMVGIFDASSPELRTPTVPELQDATGRDHARAVATGSFETRRKWAKALGLDVSADVPSMDTLEDATAALVERERDAQHALANVVAQRDTLRARVVAESNAAPRKETDDDIPL